MNKKSEHRCCEHRSCGREGTVRTPLLRTPLLRARRYSTNTAVANTAVAVAQVQYEHRCCDQEPQLRSRRYSTQICGIMMVNAPSHVLEKDLACTQISDGPFPVHLRSGGTDMLPARIMKANIYIYIYISIVLSLPSICSPILSLSLSLSLPLRSVRPFPSVVHVRSSISCAEQSRLPRTAWSMCKTRGLSTGDIQTFGLKRTRAERELASYFHGLVASRG